MVVINQPRALGKMAIDECMRADPNGYTLCQANWGHVVALAADSAATGESPPYDPGRRLVPIGLMAEAQYVLITNEATAKTFPEFVAYARANPGKLTFAVQGPFPILVAGILRSVLGIDMVEIPYIGPSGDARAMADLVAGHIQAKVSEVASMRSFLGKGRVSLLGVFAGKGRSPFFPELPTLTELGAPQFELLQAWTALWAPPGTPPEIVGKLNAALVKALNDPEVEAAFQNLGIVPRSGTPEDLAELRKSIPALAELIKKHNIRIFGK